MGSFVSHPKNGGFVDNFCEKPDKQFDQPLERYFTKTVIILHIIPGMELQRSWAVFHLRSPVSQKT